MIDAMFVFISRFSFRDYLILYQFTGIRVQPRLQTFESVNAYIEFYESFPESL